MKKTMFVLFVFTMFLLSGCYWNTEALPNQMAVELEKGAIQDISGPGGVYSKPTCYFCDITLVNIDTLTFSVEDPEVLTSDNQAVGVKITIQARRQSSDEAITNLITKWSALVDDATLINTISATAREGMKNGVRNFTLTQLLDDRNGLADAIREQLELDASKYGAEVVNVTVENIAPSAEYMAILGETANVKANTDKAIREQDLINQTAKNQILEQQKRVEVANAKVLAEQAETLVQVEIAKRQGQVVAAQNEVYSLNPQAFELEKLRLLQNILGEGTIYFIPAGTDLTTYFFQNFNGVAPVPAQ